MTANLKRGPRTKTLIGSLLAAALLLITTGCTSKEPGRATAPPAAKTSAAQAPATHGDRLAGAAWYVRHISVGGRTTIAPPPTAAWIEFRDGNSAEGNYACTPFKAVATITEAAVTVGEKTDGAPPAKQCPASNLAFEGKLRKLFSGRLTLSHPVDELTMNLTNQRGDYVALQLLRPKGLFGHRWQLTHLVADDGGIIDLIGGKAVYYVFHRDVLVTGSTGCNDFAGRAVSDRDVLTMYQPVRTTHRTCSRELMQQEHTLLTYKTNPRRMGYGGAFTSSFSADDRAPLPHPPGYHWAAIPGN